MRVGIAAMVFGMALGLLGTSGADARVYVPGVKIVQEVRTAQGTLRSYQRPGLPPTYWDQSFPALSGDRVTLDALVATGGAELGEVRFLLDSKEVVKLTRGPWRTELDTTGLVVGSHALEVRAKTAPPHAREAVVKAALVIVPNDARTAEPPAQDTEASEQERLSAVIGCLNPDLDSTLDARAEAVLAQPELFYASAGPTAKEFFYTLSRDRKVYYTSPLLPISTLLYLEPAAPGLLSAAGPLRSGAAGAGAPPAAQAKETGAEEAAAAADEVMLTLQVGDGDGHFGPPVWASLQLQPGATVPQEAKP